MDRNAMEENVKRLATLMAKGPAPEGMSDAESDEAMGLTIGLLGTLVISAVRIADAVERLAGCVQPVVDGRTSVFMNAR